ncbi:hypothetical protein BD410DRAFT_844367 [Rickenella mellea]|uniref:Uncharacterized protein n=1 Tax=Rickenella mellea TaxID=50990 RepID=A0A4Y7PM26_9AGAM|nr:hypothetical protein BD410DRAFT_844367 [Rickenella mellea]
MSANSNSLDPVKIQASHTQRVEEWIFLILQVTGGQILLPIIIATSLFSKSTPRHTIFLNFCLSWSLSSIIFSLLLYRERSTPEEVSLTPGPNICIIQAALVNGIQAMTSCTTLALVIHIWSVFRQTGRYGSPSDSLLRPGLRNAAFLLVPSLFFASFAIVTLVVGNVPTDNSKGDPVPNLAVATAFYCVILQADGTLKLLQGVYSFSAALAVITLLFEGLTMFEIYRSKKVLKKYAPKGTTAVFIRIAMFSLLRTFVLGFTFIFAIEPQRVFQPGLTNTFVFNGFIDVLQASLPLAAALILGTQKDFLDVWFFCKRNGTSKQVLQVDVIQEKLQY